MASDNEASCIADPNFAVICSFLERFAESCGIVHPGFAELQDMLENSDEVDGQLVDLHVKLLRKARKSVSAEKWERALIKFGHTYNSQDGWELERFGYKKAALATKLRVLKALLEAQFDLNARFKAAVNKLTASELRTKPLGRDSLGQVYWSQQDVALNLRVYREDEQEASWTLIAKDRESLAELISTLSGGRLDAEALAEAAGDEEEEEELTSSVDEVEGEILLDTGQPEEAQPPGITNGQSPQDEKSSDQSQEEDLKKVHEMPPAGGEETVNLSIPSLVPPHGVKRKLEEPEENESKKLRFAEVGEAIEEPVMLVSGPGAGAECETAFLEEQCEVGEAIEEPLMFVLGHGAGAECNTGNPGEEKEKEEKKEESPNKVSRWDSSQATPPKDKAGGSSAGMVSDWVREAETPGSSQGSPAKPSIFSPSKSSLWSIDKICAPAPSSSVFSSGMLFGNLSKPTFVSSPERSRLTDSPLTVEPAPEMKPEPKPQEPAEPDVSIPESTPQEQEPTKPEVCSENKDLVTSIQTPQTISNPIPETSDSKVEAQLSMENPEPDTASVKTPPKLDNNQLSTDKCLTKVQEQIAEVTQSSSAVQTSDATGKSGSLGKILSAYNDDSSTSETLEDKLKIPEIKVTQCSPQPSKDPEDSTPAPSILKPSEALTFKGSRRKSVEAISLGIMEKKMNLVPSVSVETSSDEVVEPTVVKQSAYLCGKPSSLVSHHVPASNVISEGQNIELVAKPVIASTVESVKSPVPGVSKIIEKPIVPPVEISVSVDKKLDISDSVIDTSKPEVKFNIPENENQLDKVPEVTSGKSKSPETPIISLKKPETKPDKPEDSQKIIKAPEICSGKSTILESSSLISPVLSKLPESEKLSTPVASSGSTLQTCKSPVKSAELGTGTSSVKPVEHEVPETQQLQVASSSSKSAEQLLLKSKVSTKMVESIETAVLAKAKLSERVVEKVKTTAVDVPEPLDKSGPASLPEESKKPVCIKEKQETSEKPADVAKVPEVSSDEVKLLATDSYKSKSLEKLTVKVGSDEKSTVVSTEDASRAKIVAEEKLEVTAKVATVEAPKLIESVLKVSQTSSSETLAHKLPPIEIPAVQKLPASPPKKSALQLMGQSSDSDKHSEKSKSPVRDPVLKVAPQDKPMEKSKHIEKASEMKQIPKTEPVKSVDKSATSLKASDKPEISTKSAIKPEFPVKLSVKQEVPSKSCEVPGSKLPEKVQQVLQKDQVKPVKSPEKELEKPDFIGKELEKCKKPTEKTNEKHKLSDVIEDPVEKPKSPVTGTIKESANKELKAPVEIVRVPENGSEKQSISKVALEKPKCLVQQVKPAVQKDAKKSVEESVEKVPDIAQQAEQLGKVAEDAQKAETVAKADIIAATGSQKPDLERPLEAPQKISDAKELVPPEVVSLTEVVPETSKNVKVEVKSVQQSCEQKKIVEIKSEVVTESDSVGEPEAKASAEALAILKDVPDIKPASSVPKESQATCKESTTSTRENKVSEAIEIKAEVCVPEEAPILVEKVTESTTEVTEDKFKASTADEEEPPILTEEKTEVPRVTRGKKAPEIVSEVKPEAAAPELTEEKSETGRAIRGKKAPDISKPEASLATDEKAPELTKEKPARATRARKATEDEVLSEEKAVRVTRGKGRGKAKAEESEMPKLEQEAGLPLAKEEESPPVLGKPEAPVTIGSALTFDYNPPPSPEVSDRASPLGIDQGSTGKKPQRSTRGRGRPGKRAAAAEEHEAKTPTKGRGRGRVVSRGKKTEDQSEARESLGVTEAQAADAPVLRQSRRIAQIKQKEEEDRRKQEAEALAEMQRLREEERRRKELEVAESSSPESSDSDSDQLTANGSPKKKKKRKYKKRKNKTQDEDYIGVADDDIARRKRKKKKKKRRKKKRAGANPWESSDTSDSSSQQSEGLDVEEEEEEEEPRELKSDHEFSPESDLELGPGEELQPAPRRARTARREKAPSGRKDKGVKEVEEPEEDEYRCQKCNGVDRPEWILLCDSCDNGWHTSCLRPELHLVPEGDWYCPECSHQQLVTSLTVTLRELDKATRRKTNQELRRQRLAYVGISLDNIIPSKGEEQDDEDESEDDALQGAESGGGSDGGGAAEEGSEDDDESSGSATSSSSSSSEEEDKYPLRQRRAAQTVNYNFTEYDEMIKNAIQDEVDAAAGAGNAGRGKDIATIVNAQKEEEAAAAEEQPAAEEEAKEPESAEDEEEEDDEDKEERQRQHAELVKLSQRRKPRRLACLDVSSEDDHASDEDFHGSLSEDEDEDEAFNPDSEDSGARGNRGPVRRSTRARQTRYDREFINDDSDDSEVERKKRKAKRARGWLGSDEDMGSSQLSSESGESDWGSRNKRKRKAPTRTRSRAPAKRRKRSGGAKRGKGRKGKAPAARKRTVVVGSDSEEKAAAPAPKAKRPKPPPREPSPEEEPQRRTTRGKKINYQEIIGSDSDDAKPTRGKGRRIISDDEDEFRPDEEDLAHPRTGKPASVLHNRVVKPPTPEPLKAASPAPAPAVVAAVASGVPVTAVTLQQTLGGAPMPQIVQVSRVSDNSDEESESPKVSAPVVAPPILPVVSPVKRGAGAGRARGTRGRGRGRGGVAAAAKITLSSESEESDPGLPATLPRAPKDDKPPAYSPASAPVPPQYPPSQQSTVISRLLQAPISPASTQPFTAAAAASIAAKFYPAGTAPANTPPSYPSPTRQPAPQGSPGQQPSRFPTASTPPMNYRPPVRMRGAPPNVTMAYPSPGILDTDKGAPPAYRATPPPSRGPSFQRPQFQPPPPYPPNQAPYFSSYVEDAPGQYPQPFPEAFSGEPGSYETPPVPRNPEEGSGEFGGLVSYFSSQREDDLES